MAEQTKLEAAALDLVTASRNKRRLLERLTDPRLTEEQLTATVAEFSDAKADYDKAETALVNAGKKSPAH